MDKGEFLKNEYISLRDEIKETKTRLFRLAAVGIVGMPSAYTVAKLYSVDALILSLPLLICTLVLIYLAESKALMRCGTYIKYVIENNVEGCLAAGVGWEHWLSKQDSGGPDRRAVDKLMAAFFYLLFVFYYFASSNLAVSLASEKYGVVGMAAVLGLYIAIGIIFLWILFINYKASTSTS
jgi:hypothetical protein